MKTIEDRGIRLVTNSDAKMSLDFELALELSTNRLREALAILRAIEAGEILGEAQAGEAGDQTRIAASLLAILQRELEAIIVAQDDLVRDPRPTAARME